VKREHGLIREPAERVAIFGDDAAIALDPNRPEIIGSARRHAVLVPSEVVNPVRPALSDDGRSAK
jgi:hypothetical protein